MKCEENLWFNADNITKLFTFLGLQVKIWTTSSGPVTFVLPSWHRHLGKFEEVIKLKIYSFSFFLPYTYLLISPLGHKSCTILNTWGLASTSFSGASVQKQ